MKEIDITSLQQICGLRGHNVFDIIRPICMCNYVDWCIKQYEKQMGFDFILLGFLNEKDTLIAMYGEKEYEYASNGEKCGYKNKGWQYHAQQTIGFSPTEILSYWRGNKK